MKKVFIITLLLVIAMMLQAQNPPRNLQAVGGDGFVTLTWDAPIIDGLYQVRYHDSNPFNAYWQYFNRGYGVVYDLTQYENPVLQRLDFRHSPYNDIMGPHDYNLHILDWDEREVITIIENLQTTVDDDWETDINLGEIEGVDNVAIFLEPLGHDPDDAYPVIDCDPNCDFFSYVVNITNDYSVIGNLADGDFLMDLWVSADGVGRPMAVKAPRVARAATQQSNDLREPRLGVSSQKPLSRSLDGYIVYRDDVAITPTPIDETTFTDVNVNNGTSYEYWVTARYSEGGESDTTSHVIVIPDIPQGVLLTEGFEGGIPSNWSVIDADGDNYNWFLNDESFPAHDGTRCVISASYINDVGPLTPDNYLITPAIELEYNVHLYFWVHAQDPQWFNEHYKVKLSTTGHAIDDFTVTLHDETLMTSNWIERDIDLSQYTGETVYIAFEHCDVTDMFYIKLDDVLIKDPTSTSDESVAALGITTSCYPNPFNPETTISFNLPEKSQVTLDVFNIRGQKVTTLLNDRVDAGQKQVVWHGTDQNGSPVSSGVYFYKLTANGQTLVRKIALMK